MNEENENLVDNLQALDMNSLFSNNETISSNTVLEESKVLENSNSEYSEDLNFTLDYNTLYSSVSNKTDDKNIDEKKELLEDNYTFNYTDLYSPLSQSDKNEEEVKTSINDDSISIEQPLSMNDLVTEDDYRKTTFDYDTLYECPNNEEVVKEIISDEEILPEINDMEFEEISIPTPVAQIDINESAPVEEIVPIDEIGSVKNFTYSYEDLYNISSKPNVIEKRVEEQKDIPHINTAEAPSFEIKSKPVENNIEPTEYLADEDLISIDIEEPNKLPIGNVVKKVNEVKSNIEDMKKLDQTQNNIQNPVTQIMKPRFFTTPPRQQTNGQNYNRQIPPARPVPNGYRRPMPNNGRSINRPSRSANAPIPNYNRQILPTRPVPNSYGRVNQPNRHPNANPMAIFGNENVTLRPTSGESMQKQQEHNKVCPRCGFAIKDNQQVCVVCGTRVQ